MRTKIQEIEAKSVLTASKLPDTDYVVNPYTGCEFGCSYCYASFMGRFVNEPIANWGKYVYVKVNAVEVFQQELERLPQRKRSATILMSSVTDPYQGVENKYQLTRGLLQVLAQNSYPGSVGILTKSPLILRDLDVLKQIRRVDIGMTLTTTDDKLSRFLEVRAPLVSQRLKVLRQLNDEGLSTYAFVGPLLPHFRYQPELLDELFARLAESKVRSIYVEHINLKKYIKEKLWETLKHESQAIQDVYRGASSNEHRQVLEGMVAFLTKKYGLSLRLGTVIAHDRN